MADNNNWEKEKIMRDKFQKELEELNEEIIEMGKMIVYDIQNAVKALVTHPLGKIRFAVLKSQGFQNYIGKFFSFHCKRSFI